MHVADTKCTFVANSIELTPSLQNAEISLRELCSFVSKIILQAVDKKKQFVPNLNVSCLMKKPCKNPLKVVNKGIVRVRLGMATVR